MSDQLTNPDGGGMTSGGTTAADNLRGTPTPGAGNVGGVPVNNDAAPADPTQSPSVVPSGGQKAVPDDQTIMGGMGNDAGGFGDTGGADTDDGGTGIGDGDTLPGDDASPAINPSGTAGDNSGIVPTGGLSGGGTNEA